jgi:uncharacterized protein
MPSETDLADFQAAGAENLSRHNSRRKKIWVDLDNSPHVPFFRPIIEELRKRNYEVLITARNAYQVRELLEFYEVPGKIVGQHYGKHKVLKALGTCWRAFALFAIARKEKPDLAINHGSRACLLTCAWLRIPNVFLTDYEFAMEIPFIKPSWMMVPTVVPDDRLMVNGTRVLRYPGIKEDVYLSRFHPDQGLKKRLGIPADDLLITVRPPATEAHYHNPESEKLLTEALNRFVNNPSTRILLLPRNKRQEAELRSVWAVGLAAGKILIPQHVEDGLNLIWNSDLVISGGGTMNREAAAMGVPVYSIFRGKIGAVDRYLVDQGQLVLLETVEDVRSKIKAVPRARSKQCFGGGNSPALETIVRNIVSIVESKAIASRAGSN